MKIDKKIVKYRVRKPDEKPVAEVTKLPVKESAKVIRMTEGGSGPRCSSAPRTRSRRPSPITPCT